MLWSKDSQHKERQKGKFKSRNVRITTHHPLRRTSAATPKVFVFLSLDFNFPKMKWEVKASWWPRILSVQFIFPPVICCVCSDHQFLQQLSLLQPGLREPNLGSQGQSPEELKEPPPDHKTETQEITGQAVLEVWSSSKGSKVKCQQVIKYTWQEQRLSIGCRKTAMLSLMNLCQLELFDVSLFSLIFNNVRSCVARAGNLLVGPSMSCGPHWAPTH